MKPLSEHPSIHELKQLLDESLTDSDRMRVEMHLESCPTCREQLGREGAETPWWDAAFSLLSETSGEGAETDSSEHAELRSVLAPTDDPRMLGRLGPYEIVGVIGSGGMGIVLKGLDPALNRYVALKVLRPSQAGTIDAQRRFQREGRAAAAIIHENIIAIHGVAEANSVPYLVMPYLRGESLQTRITRLGPLSLTEMLRVGYQVADGLQAAHAQGLIHRDVKPSNILLDQGVERLKLTDFGLVRSLDDASITRTGTLAGTPEYMSPEQAMGKPIDARSDLFSLGVLLWTMSIGRPPFRADSCYGVIKAIVDAEPPSIRSFDPSLPIWWEELVAKLMNKRPEDRFENASLVALILHGCLAHVQDTSKPLPPQLRHSRRSSRRLIGWSVAIAIGVFLSISATVIRPVVFTKTNTPESKTSVDDLTPVKPPKSRRTMQDRVNSEGQATSPSQLNLAPLEPSLSVAKETAAEKPSPNNEWDDGTVEQLEDIRERVRNLDSSTFAP
ncbi:MAG: protein kinase [Planctomycetota bacterium]